MRLRQLVMVVSGGWSAVALVPRIAGTETGQTWNVGDPTTATALTVPDAFAGGFGVRAFERAKHTLAALDPEGNVVVSVYSSGAIGRLVPEDVAGMVGYLREKAAHA